MKRTIVYFVACALPAMVASGQTVSYNLTDLGSLGPLGQPLGLTSNQLVTGADASGPNSQVTLWYRGTRMDLGKPTLGGANVMGLDVNVKAQIVGLAETAISDPEGEDFCAYGTHSVCLPFILQFGLMYPLPTLGGKSGIAATINSQGLAGGMAETNLRDASCPAPQKYQFKPVIWTNGVAQELPLAAGDNVGEVHGMNDSGAAVGSSGACSAYNANFGISLQPLHALLWQNGVATDLGNLGGKGAFFGTRAWSINNKGQVVGHSDLRGDQSAHAFMWQNGKMTDLGTVPGDASSVAIALNDNGDAVGVSLDNNFNIRAFRWSNGVMQDLNAMVPADAALYLLTGCNINSAGQIIGIAADKKTGNVHGYLLTPVATADVRSSISPALRSVATPLVPQRPTQGRFRGWGGQGN